MRLRTARAAALLVAAAFALGVVAVGHASPGLSVSDLDHGVTATDLANAIAGSGVSVSNVTYTGANRAAGTFSGGSGVFGFDGGIVLSTGYVQTVSGDTACSQGVEGPNNCYEGTDANPSGGPDGGSNSTSMATAGDPDLSALSGFDTFDAAVLQFDFVPQTSSLTFNYVFSSEEYSDFSNTQFNDVFAFFVNGTNCALVPGTTDPVSINTINNGNDAGGDTTPHHPELFRDNVNPSPSIDTQMDGLTVTLTCTASVNAGQTNHMKIAIADASDDAFDSAVFIQAGSLASTHSLTVSKSGNGSGSVSSS
ncbi:MAG: choice-of-anchor L domain-containing protein, partial [Gaiellaceae bacterium]